ncbi:unnamed protein product [Hapterophycus canaliculatus]
MVGAGPVTGRERARGDDRDRDGTPPWDQLPPLHPLPTLTPLPGIRNLDHVRRANYGAPIEQRRCAFFHLCNGIETLKIPSAGPERRHCNEDKGFEPTASTGILKAHLSMQTTDKAQTSFLRLPDAK